jgi:hypothetical protein
MLPAWMIEELKKREAARRPELRVPAPEPPRPAPVEPERSPRPSAYREERWT